MSDHGLTSRRNPATTAAALIATAAVVVAATWYCLAHVRAPNSADDAAAIATDPLSDAEHARTFQEITSRFGLTRANLSIFTIYGPDKAAYSTNKVGSGITWVYKTDGTWKIAACRSAGSAAL